MRSRSPCRPAPNTSSRGLADPSSLKEGGGDAEPASEKFVNAFLMSSEGLELAELFSRLKSPRLRKRIVELVRSMVEDED